MSPVCKCNRIFANVEFTIRTCNPAAFGRIIRLYWPSHFTRSSHGEPTDVPSGICGRERTSSAPTAAARKQRSCTEQEARPARGHARGKFLLGQADAGAHA